MILESIKSELQKNGRLKITQDERGLSLTDGFLLKSNFLPSWSKPKVREKLIERKKRSGQEDNLSNPNLVTVFTLYNKEIHDLRGEIELTSNPEKGTCFVEMTLEVKDVRGSWWWFWALSLTLVTSGVGLGFILYSYITVPNTTALKERSTTLINSVLSNAANKCEALA